MSPDRYQQVVADLEALATHPIDNTPPNAARRLRRLLDERGAPDQSMRIVVVAGTCGKGSTAAMLASILSAAGQRVGLFTGPHLVLYTERMQINGVAISVQEWCQRTASVLGMIDPTSAKHARTRPSVLEILAVVALEWFRERGVTWAVIEAGMGGARDCSGALHPEVCVLTQIDLDHMHVLGRTISEIATEKAGIIRRGVPLVCCATKPDAQYPVVARSAAMEAPLHLLGRDFYADNVICDDTAVQFDYDWPAHDVSYKDLVVRLLGSHQAANAATAVTAAGLLMERGRPLADEAHIRKGLESVVFPGRLEWWPTSPPILLDGAHQVAGAKALRAAWHDIYSGWRKVLMLGVLADKDREGMVSVLAQGADAIVVTQPPWVARAGDLAELGALVREFTEHGTPVETCDDVRQGLAVAAKLAATLPSRALICVAGSLYLVGAVREVLLGESKPF